MPQMPWLNPSIDNYTTVEAECGGVPVYSFNNLIYIYGQSPDFYPFTPLQAGNDHPVTKLRLKKSWEIEDNFIGICHEMTPRTRLNDSQPFLPIHLIDGDPETIWASFECMVPDAREEWIRLDFPAEHVISSVVLMCNKKYMGKAICTTQWGKNRWNFGKSLPRELSVKISRDAWHWDTAFECNNILARADAQPGELERFCVMFDRPVTAKQILITGKNFSGCGYEGYMFSISGVEALDLDGRNLALVSNGTGVTVSSTSDAHNSDRYSANSLWGPLQYDLGCKWVKCGSDNGSLLWCFAEHEKGVLEVDAEADVAITDAAKNGMKVIMTLDFKGNWAYDSPKMKKDWRQARFRELNDSYLGEVPLATDSAEMFEGYLRYVEYMVRHFKDRVAYFEIGNEWQGWVDNVNWYKNEIFEPTYDKIKEAAPDAKILMCSVTNFGLTEEVLCCLGPGVLAQEGWLTVKDRMLAAVQNFDTEDVIVDVDACSASACGLVLRYKDKNNFLAAVYEPGNQLYFLECVGDHSWDKSDIISMHEHKNAVPTKKMGNSIHMKAMLSDGRVTFVVSDGINSISTTCDLDNCAISGSAGILHCPGDTTDTFSHFRAIDASGNILFADDFDGKKPLAENWELEWNHWGNPDRLIAALRIDGVGWHSANTPDNEYYDRIRKFRRNCEALGFKGSYFCNEIYAGSVYPPGKLEGNLFRMTDMEEAKYHARSLAGYGGLNIEAGPCHVSLTGFPHPQSTCRTTVPSQVVAPSQPKPSHYVIRNLCTAMDGFYEAEFPVSFSNEDNLVSFPLEKKDKSERMLAIWYDVPLADDVSSKTVSIILPGCTVEKAVGIDALNGLEQELNMIQQGGNIILQDIRIRDYPLLIQLRK